MTHRKKTLNEGFSLPILNIIIVIISILIFIFGWMILIYVFVLGFFFTMTILIYDKINHAKKCKECFNIKKVISKEKGINIDLIKTKHLKYFDTYMYVKVYLKKMNLLLLKYFMVPKNLNDLNRE